MAGQQESRSHAPLVSFARGPWHGFAIGPEAPALVTACIEIVPTLYGFIRAPIVGRLSPPSAVPSPAVRRSPATATRSTSVSSRRSRLPTATCSCAP